MIVPAAQRALAASLYVPARPLRRLSKEILIPCPMTGVSVPVPQDGKLAAAADDETIKSDHRGQQLSSLPANVF